MNSIVSDAALRVISDIAEGIVPTTERPEHFPVLFRRRDVFSREQADAFVEKRAQQLSNGSDRLYNIVRIIDMVASEIDDYPDMRVQVAAHVHDLSTAALLRLAGRPAVDLVAYVLLSQAASYACANAVAYDYLVRAYELEEHTDCVKVADCGFYGEVGEQILLMMAEILHPEDDDEECFEACDGDADSRAEVEAAAIGAAK